MSVKAPGAPGTPPIPTATIHDIPPQILIKISFINARRDWTPFSANFFTDTPAGFSLPCISDTIRASHVCRRWRDILISAPELWMNMVDPSDMEWTRVILERSRPLGVTLVPPRGKREFSRTKGVFETEEISQELLERLLEYHFPQGFSFVDNVAQVKLPRLQFLYLEVSPLRPVPRGFPGYGTTPVLKHLHLERNFINIERLRSLSATLTRLTLVNLEPGSRILPYHMVTIITQLPNLQGITLQEALSSMSPEYPVTSRPVRLLDISLMDIVDHVSSFFRCAEFSPPLHRVHLHYQKLEWQQELGNMLIKAANIFDIFCSSVELERYRLYIGPGEITYTSLSGPFSIGDLTNDRQFRLRLALMELPDLSLDRILPTFLPLWLYTRVEHLTIPLPIFDLRFYEELGEEIVVEMLHRFSNVRVLDEVGPKLWDLLYRWPQPVDVGDRILLPSLRKIVFHRGCIPAAPEPGEDKSTSVSDGSSSEAREDLDQEHGDLTTAVLASTRELLPESDSEDESFVDESEKSDSFDDQSDSSNDQSDSSDDSEQKDPSGSEDSTESDPLIKAGKKVGSWEFYDNAPASNSKEVINVEEILEFCSRRPEIKTIVISDSTASDSEVYRNLQLALGEAGVTVEFWSSATE